MKFLLGQPQIHSIAAYDTAGSVKMIMESREGGAAAIASAAAAEVYGAQILIPGIEDDQANFTRFLLLAREDAQSGAPPGADKTSIVFSLEHRAGSLYRAMAVFALRDIDLMKIESRPLVGRPWEYSFYLDFIGAIDEPRVRNAMAHLAEFASSVKILGCYKQAVTTPGE